MSIKHARCTPATGTASTPNEAEIKRRLDFADAALGAACHQVTDPAAREVARQIAAGTLTADEAAARQIAGLGTSAVDEAEIKRRLDFADGALGAAGHQVTDPVLRELRREAIRGDITTDEAIAAGVAHIDSRIGIGAVDEAEIKRRLDFADGALGAAGHQVTDPTLNELARQVAAGTMTAEEAIVRGLKHIDATFDTR